MKNPSTLKKRYEEVKNRIGEAACRIGRKPEDIRLVAVTKYARPEQIRELIQLGHADFGENRVQNLTKRVAAIDEFLQRHHTLTSSRPVSIPDQVRWHMIGHLQRNKAKKVAGLVNLIHSVDTLRLAEEIQEAALKLDRTISLLVQVDTAREPNKFGCHLSAVPHFAETINTMVGLRFRGLMTMAPLTTDTNRIRDAFLHARDAFLEIRNSGIAGKHCDILSMGMSSDYEIAIECGANIVRVVTAIFGPREDNLDSPTEHTETHSQNKNNPSPNSQTNLNNKQNQNQSPNTKPTTKNQTPEPPIVTVLPHQNKTPNLSIDN